MLIVKQNKGNNFNVITILNVKIYELYYEYLSGYRKQIFLSGLVKTDTKINKFNRKKIKTVKFFGKIIYKKIVGNDDIYYVFGKKIVLHFSKLKMLERKIQKKASFNFDSVYILNANSGETFLFLAYIFKNMLIINHEQTPLLIATKKYHIDIIKMLHPNFKFIYIKNLSVGIDKNHFRINDKNYYVLFPYSHFYKTEQKIKKLPVGNYHYFKSILETLNLNDSNLSYQRIIKNQTVLTKMRDKIQLTGLNLDKFIFISTSANSCESYDNGFWNMLCESLAELNYDIFLNEISSKALINSKFKVKTSNLTFEEVFWLAKLSKGIISLRSGLNENLIQTNVAQYILYTKFKNRFYFNDIDAKYILSGFTLSKLPHVNQALLYEYDATKLAKTEIINDILKNIVINNQ